AVAAPEVAVAARAPGVGVELLSARDALRRGWRRRAGIRDRLGLRLVEQVGQLEHVGGDLPPLRLGEEGERGHGRPRDAALDRSQDVGRRRGPPRGRAAKLEKPLGEVAGARIDEVGRRARPVSPLAVTAAALAQVERLAGPRVGRDERPRQQGDGEHVRHGRSPASRCGSRSSVSRLTASPPCARANASAAAASRKATMPWPIGVAAAGTRANEAASSGTSSPLAWSSTQAAGIASCARWIAARRQPTSSYLVSVPLRSRISPPNPGWLISIRQYAHVSRP